ncbi:MAG: hypothetical protein KBG48_27845 [Kofleriaceae bacterium]|jgi:hypothetical protein|nr:hypothetical protein [Kofleriaceae bacterium]MBP9171244.1 hypothetical protein [Kofleriaceae bacterium]MBP9862231.1 hypothetical protein [Kofleriaceae bacterium]
MRMSIWILPCALAACAVELPPDPDPGSADTTAGAPTLPPLHARTPQVARELERARVHALHAEERLRARRAELARLHALLDERGYPTEVHAALDELFARDLAGREVARFADGSPVIERVGCDEVAAVLGEEAPTTLLGFGPIFSCSPGDQLAQVRAENAAWSRYVTRGDRAALAALDDGAAILATLDGKVTP